MNSVGRYTRLTRVVYSSVREDRRRFVQAKAIVQMALMPEMIDTINVKFEQLFDAGFETRSMSYLRGCKSSE